MAQKNLKVIKTEDIKTLKLDDVVSLVYTYTYKGKPYCMVKRLSDKTTHDTLVSNLEEVNEQGKS